MEVFIHVGYPKTGTTFLQEKIFPNIKNVIFKGKNFVYENIWLPSQIRYNPEKILRKINNEIQDTGINRVLLSHEGLIGTSHLSGYNLMITDCYANRLKNTFPHAKIIIFIRNQINIIASEYCQYLKGGGNYSVSKYLLSKIKLNSDNLFVGFNYDFYLYHHIINIYSKLFGDENVYVFLYEDFQYNPEQFLKIFLNKFDFNFTCQLESNYYANRKYHYFLIPLVRFANMFFKGKRLNKYYIIHVPGMFKLTRKLFYYLNNMLYAISKNNVKKILGTKKIEYIKKHYRKSNQALIYNYNLKKLKEYKYPL